LTLKLEFIDSLDIDSKAKIRNSIRLLEEYGLGLLSDDRVKKVNSHPSIYELRVRSTFTMRLLFSFIKPDTFIILHGFIKKTNKLPKQELYIAIKRVREFI